MQSSTRTKRSGSSTEADHCPVCQSVVKNGDRATQCDQCDLWVHTSCSKMSSKTYEALMCDGDSLSWLCKPCKVTSKMFAKRLNCIEKEQGQLKTKVEGQHDLIMELQNQVDNLKQEVKENMLHQPSSSLVQTVKDLDISTLSRELKKEDQRQNNVIIEGTVPQITKKDEVKLVKELAECLDVELKESEITTKRVGKKLDNGKQRLIVTLPPEKRKDLLRNSKKLSTLQGKKDIFIQQDLNNFQRKAQFQLRQQRRQKQTDQPEKTWVIYKGKVIEKKNRTQKA